MPIPKLARSLSSVWPPTSKAAILFASANALVAMSFWSPRKNAPGDWPRESLDDLIAVPNDAGPPLMIDLTAFINRKLKVDGGGA